MKLKSIIAMQLAVLAAVHGNTIAAPDYWVFKDHGFNIDAAPGTTFDIQSHFVWASARATLNFQPGCKFCDESGLYIAADSDSGALSANAHAFAGPPSQGAERCPHTDTQSNSAFLSLTTDSISWVGFINGIGYNSGCDQVPVIHESTGSVGAEVVYTVDGDFTIPALSCPSAPSGSSPSRRVDANLLCLPTGPIASYVISQNGMSFTDCPSGSITLGAGTYSISSVSVAIDDTIDDVTADGRFNQDDVDFLVNNVVGTGLASDPIYTDRFDFQGNGTVDSFDTDIVQCFVDACLDARRIGDANCDNVVDCSDLLIAGTHPFAGEDFTGSVYNVGFDTDLDGDNDAADKAVISNRMLQLEPANFNLDNSLDFFDTSAFLSLFAAQDPRADLNGDGFFDFFDTSIFLTAMANPNCL